MKQKSTIRTTGAPAAVGPYSQAIAAGGFLFTAGQIALDPEGGSTAGSTVGEQTARVLENLRAVLEAGGATPGDVVKTTVYLSDLNGFGEMNEVYARFFGDWAPARSCVEVSRLPKGALVEIDAVAVVKRQA